MRKFTLLILGIIATMVTYGQISITSAEIIGAGDVIIQANDEDPDASIVPGDAGANIEWDFSALAETSLDTLNFMDPDQTPYGGDFPEANLAMTVTDSGYFYMNKNTQQMSWIGMVMEIDTLGMIMADVVPEDVVAEFPIEFGNMYSGSHYIMFDLESDEPEIDSIRFKMSTEKSNEVDAWGQVTLPMGTFNALRVHETRTTIDSIWVKTAIGWMFTYSFQSESESYSWWSDDPGTGFVIATLDMENETEVSSATYMKTEVIGDIHELGFESYNLNAYPNPVENRLNISLSKDFDGLVKVMDLTGQTVKEKQISGDQVILKMEDLPSGLYIYEVSKNSGLRVYTGKIVKR